MKLKNKNMGLKFLNMLTSNLVKSKKHALIKQEKIIFKDTA